nr:hypothetical protein [Woeseiaceae bacterium]
LPPGAREYASTRAGAPPAPILGTKKSPRHPIPCNIAAIYPMADNHVGVMSNDCTLQMIPAILADGEAAATVPGC